MKSRLGIDEVDLKIMALLQQDGRMRDAEVARKVGVSHDTVKRRRERLEREGYLKVVATINPSKFGLAHVFSLGVTLAPGSDVRDVARKLATIDMVYFVALSLGPTHSIVATCRSSDMDKLNKLVEELRNWPEIERVDVNIVYEVIKSSYHTIPESLLKEAVRR